MLNSRNLVKSLKLMMMFNAWITVQEQLRINQSMEEMQLVKQTRMLFLVKWNQSGIQMNLLINRYYEICTRIWRLIIFICARITPAYLIIRVWHVNLQFIAIVIPIIVSFTKTPTSDKFKNSFNVINAVDIVILNAKKRIGRWSSQGSVSS